jgi:hypothetical protein
MNRIEKLLPYGANIPIEHSRTCVTIDVASSLSLFDSSTGIAMGVGAGVPAYSYVSAVAGVLAPASVPASTGVHCQCPMKSVHAVGRETFFLHTLHMELAGC